MNKLDEYERAMIDVNQTLLLSALFIELTSEYKEPMPEAFFCDSSCASALSTMVERNSVSLGTSLLAPTDAVWKSNTSCEVHIRM